MTNREKFAEQILDIACSGELVCIDLKSGKPVYCSDIYCKECLYNNDQGCNTEKIKEWSNSEYIEKPKISKNDRWFLDYLPKKAWIARDEDGDLYLFYKNKPKKGLITWYNKTGYYTFLSNVDFPMVKWEDSEPWLIEDLKKLEVEG